MNGSIGIQPVSTRFGSSQNGPQDNRDGEAAAAASDSAAPIAPEEPPEPPAPPPPGLGKIVDVTI